MSNEFDINKVAADFVQQNIGKMLQVAKSATKDAKSLVRVHLESTYGEYITRMLDRHARAKSFFIRSEPIPLYEFFVPLDLGNEIRILTRPRAVDLSKISRLSILTGSGGSGKSMMMRHLLVSAITDALKTPIFLEVRDFNQSELSLQEMLLQTLQSTGLPVDEKFLEMGLSSGQFYLLLDGFDEVKQANRKRFASEIQELAQKYPKCWITVSSRPDTVLHGWNTFAQFRVLPLTIDSAVSLVEKLPFDAAIKNRFIADMKEYLFDEHASFLSNPLLLSIMLITYSDIAHIPQKLSAFYSQAYDSLFHRHDALKGGFQRDRRTLLDAQDFSRVFSAFSVLSYDQREFSFTHSRALQITSEAQNIAMLTFESEAYLEDAIQAVCLLVEEGLQISFAHRSFQEYFVARFIQGSAPEIKAELIERFSPTIESDAVMALLHEIDPYVVEKYYLLPRLAKIREQAGFKKRFGLSHFVRILKHMYSEIEMYGDEDLSMIIRNIDLHSASGFAFSQYRRQNELPLRDSMQGAKIGKAFSDEFGSHRIETSRLTTRSQFVRMLFEHGRYWSRYYYEVLFEIEAEIRVKH